MTLLELAPNMRRFTNRPQPATTRHQRTVAGVVAGHLRQVRQLMPYLTHDQQREILDHVRSWGLLVNVTSASERTDKSGGR